ncbi:MAG: nicotinate-nucleotide adenylyltransferase [Chloroflexi bacterium]|nr:nicotinate-nucleotide adenylyltransferase [Chloroflexota bacterium]
MRLGVLGGTFDPVHLGHLILGETAREQLRLERLLFVVARQPWRKAARAVAPAEHRLAMLRLAAAGNPWFEVSTMELERPGPTYTVDTLEGLRRENRGAELFFLVGSDALLDLPNWRQPERIVELATLALARRPGGGLERGDLSERLPGLTSRVVEIDMPLIDISASAVRERVRKGLSIRYLAPEAVEAYIRELGLYRA